VFRVLCVVCCGVELRVLRCTLCVMRRVRCVVGYALCVVCCVLRVVQ